MEVEEFQALLQEKKVNDKAMDQLGFLFKLLEKIRALVQGRQQLATFAEAMSFQGTLPNFENLTPDVENPQQNRPPSFC